MKIRRFFTVLIVCVSCITFFSVPVSAAETTSYNTIDFDVSAKGRYYESGNTIDDDYTSKVTVTSSSYLSEPCTLYSLPIDTIYTFRFVSGFQIANLNASHEYNLSFKYQTGAPNNTLFGVYLCFYDSAGKLLREQALFEPESHSVGWNNVDINFMPDTSGLGGYNTKLEFRFVYSGQSVVNLRLSEFVELTDKNDVTGLLESILSAILKLDSDIDTYISDLESSLINQLITLDSNIDGYFDELGGELVSAITTFDSHIDGYFQLLKDGIIENDNALSDKLHEYLDKYKPRFYEQFTWIYGYIDSTTGDRYVNSKTNAIISDLFLVSDTPYYVEFKKPVDSTYGVNCYVYDLQRNYIRWFSVTPDKVFTLEPGYYYRFRVSTKDGVLQDIHGDKITEFCNGIVLVYSDEGWLSSFGKYIVREFNQIMNPGVYEDPGSDNFQDNKDEWEQIEGELPTFDSSDMHEVDISNYSGGFGAVRYLFDRFLYASDLTTLMSFSLMFGLGVFLIGRKVGG